MVRNGFLGEVTSDGCCVGKDAWERQHSKQRESAQKPKVKKILVHLETVSSSAYLEPMAGCGKRQMWREPCCRDMSP